MTEKIFDLGQVVWCINPWGTIDQCIIFGTPTPQYNISYYKLKIKDGGEYCQMPENIFNSYKEAIIEKAKRSKKIKNEYKTKINNLKELFDFMICHMSGHETSDCEAICAAKERIKELTGIDLEEDNYIC